LRFPRVNLRSQGSRNRRGRKLSLLQGDKRVVRQNCQTRETFHLAPELDNALPLRVRSIKALAARRISSATRASGETNFGVNQGNKPIKSWVTKICPSQCSPDPIPMVGMPT